MNGATTAVITPGSGSVAHWLNNRTVNTKILAGIAMVAVVAIVIGMLSLSRMGAMNSSTNALYAQGLVPLNHVQAVQVDMSTTRQHVLDYAVSRDEADRVRYDQVIKADDAQYEREFNRAVARRLRVFALELENR